MSPERILSITLPGTRRSSFLGNLVMRLSFQSSGSLSSSHIFSKRLKRILVDVSRSTFNASSGMLPGPGDFPFLSFSTAFLILFLVGFQCFVDGVFLQVVCWGRGRGLHVLFGLIVRRSALSTC